MKWKYIPSRFKMLRSNSVKTVIPPTANEITQSLQYAVDQPVDCEHLNSTPQLRMALFPWWWQIYRNQLTKTLLHNDMKINSTWIHLKKLGEASNLHVLPKTAVKKTTTIYCIYVFLDTVLKSTLPTLSEEFLQPPWKVGTGFIPTFHMEIRRLRDVK